MFMVHILFVYTLFNQKKKKKRPVHVHVGERRKKKKNRRLYRLSLVCDLNDETKAVLLEQATLAVRPELVRFPEGRTKVPLTHNCIREKTEV